MVTLLAPALLSRAGDDVTAEVAFPQVDSIGNPGNPDTLGIPEILENLEIIDTIDSVATKKRPLLRSDSTRKSLIRKEKVDLDHQVVFSSKDSMIMLGQSHAYMYGTGKIVYGDMTLDADNIDLDLKTSTVYAVGTTDTAGEVQGSPVFVESGTSYETETMRYNFKSKRGYITDVVTQQGEGYLTGGQTKKMENDDYYIQNGRYTTCDKHDCPHFYLQLTKAKVRPGENIVTGPAYMVLAGLPLPLAIPFGYFPFSDKYSSGIIFPTFGDDYQRGFYLSDGGYYFAINDNIALALTDEIYTKGS